MFSAAMIRAILEGRKTETRRVIKPQPPSRADGQRPHRMEFVGDEEENALFVYSRGAMTGGWNARCRYGLQGGRLWVRETWSPHFERTQTASGCVYRADIDPPGSLEHIKWRPSIHMPRWAARILLEVTAVRVEKVQDITEECALREGCYGAISARNQFASLWNSINEKRGFGWENNPWVWVISFRMSK